MKSRLLEARDVCFSYDSGFTLGPVSLALDAGDVCVLAGDNGSGKTTLLRILGGQLRALQGELVGQFDPTLGVARSGLVGVVPQRELPVAGFTVSEVVSWGRLAKDGSSPPDPGRVTEAIEMVGLSGLETVDCGELSGGQYQRVTLARALASGAQVLLMDEPSANVDADSTRLLSETINRLASRGSAFVVATHDSRLLDGLGRSAITLSNGRVLA